MQFSQKWAVSRWFCNPFIKHADSTTSYVAHLGILSNVISATAWFTELSFACTPKPSYGGTRKGKRRAVLLPFACGHCLSLILWTRDSFDPKPLCCLLELENSPRVIYIRPCSSTLNFLPLRQQF
jgi:hypothetical protein